jgi:hypothetical protein
MLNVLIGNVSKFCVAIVIYSTNVAHIMRGSRWGHVTMQNYKDIVK